MLHRLAVTDPDRSALVGSGERWNYRELYTRSRRASAALDGVLEARPGVGTPASPVVAVCLAHAVDTARTVVAVEAGDRIVSVIDAHWPLALQTRLIAATSAAIVITDSASLRAALRAQGWTGPVLGLADLDGAAPTAPLDPAHPAHHSHPAHDAPFLLLTSSGTTGTPKAFLKTRAQYAANIDVSRRYLGAAEGIATFAPGPMSYSLTLYTLFEVLATGGQLHVADRLDELWLTPRAREERVTRVVTVPAAVGPLTDAASRTSGRYDGIDLVVTGGAALSTDARNRMADTMPRARTISYFGTGELGFIGDSRAGTEAIRLYPQVQARVRDDAGADVPEGEVGTLWVRSPSCSTNYLVGTSSSPLQDVDGWASVHDQGRLRGRDFSFVGRRGDIVTTGGHTVALDEVERAFAGMPGLGAVCAIAENHDRRGVRIVLVVEGDGPSGAELRAWAKERLPLASIPRRWCTLPELPRTSGGKVRRSAVAELASRARALA